MTTSKKHACWLLELASTFVLVVGAIASQAQAQVTADGTLGTNVNGSTSLPCNGGTCTITGGTRAGTNLFHSFEQFSVATSGEAHFDNAGSIQNIISRVTGGSVSNIDGQLKANGTANLFLLNPNGIMFGNQASLDIGGSFVATTASAIKFADGTEFSATPVQSSPLLTVSVPVGLQFGSTPGRIIVQGQGQGIRRLNTDLIDTTEGLRVQPDQTLALVGGDVVLSGATLKTAGGRIELGSVADNSFVSLTPIAQGIALGYDGVSSFRDIQLSESAAVDASGLGGGDIQVRGRQVTLTNGSLIEASTLGSQPGGTLNVIASDAVELIGRSANTQWPSRLAILVYPGATGAGGNLTLETRRLILRDGARIGSSTFSSAAAGTLVVRASDLVELSGTSAPGQVGSGLFTAVSPGATGAGGNLILDTRRLILRDGSVVSAISFGDGRAGTLAVSASESVELIGTSADGQFLSELTASSRGIADAGDLRISTGQLIVQDGAQVTVSGDGSGDAGNLEVQAHSIFLDNNGQLIARTASGNGGNITLNVPDLLLLRHNSQIATDARGGTGNGGNININGQFIVAVPNENSDITANAVEGRGGNINIITSGIYGQEFRPTPTPRSDITASSHFGVNGTVQINTPDVDPSRGLTNLPQQLVDVSGLVNSSCAVATSEESNFVVTGRGGVPPSPNETLRSARVLVDLGSNEDRTQHSAIPTPEGAVSINPDLNVTSASFSNPSAPLVEATGWVRGSKGEVILTAQSPTLTSHGSWLTPANCEGRYVSSK
jgi:filamentous hemagglutinin family protein